MLASRPALSRIVAWNAFLSKPFGGRKSAPHWDRWVSAASKVPSFENSEPRRLKQAYFKQGKPDGAPTTQPKGTGAVGTRLAAKPSDGKPVEMQRLAKVSNRGMILHIAHVPGTNIGIYHFMKVMAAAGVASRRACEVLIEKGEVKVNGQVVQTQGTMINPEKDVVYVSGKKVGGPQCVHHDK